MEVQKPCTLKDTGEEEEALGDYEKDDTYSADDEEWKCCQHNTSIWNCVYIIGFFGFSALLCWSGGFTGKLANYETTKRALMLLGCNVLCFISTIYIFYRYKKLYTECDDRTYTPILHTWFMASVPGVLLVLWYNYVVDSKDPKGTDTYLWKELLRSTIYGGAFPEELMKYFVFVKGYSWFGLKPTDNLTLRLMVLQATAGGMAFGTLEGFLYVTGASGEVASMLTSTAFRGFALIPLHAMWAYVSGCTYLHYYISSAKERDGEEISHRMLLFSLTTFWSIWRSFVLHAVWNIYATLLGYGFQKLISSAKTIEDVKYYALILTITQGVSVIVYLGVTFWVCRKQFRQLKETYEQDGQDPLAV